MSRNRVSYYLDAFFVLTLLLFLYALFFEPWLFVWLTYEDLPGEWAQWLAFGFAAFYAFRLSQIKKASRTYYRILFIAFLYVFFEEISWGQRVLGFASPELFQKYNIQGETNIHNFFTGPIGTDLKQALTIALSLGIFVYGISGVFYRRLLLFLSRLKSPFVKQVMQLVQRIGIEPPPLVLLPYFTVAAFFELSPFSFNEAELAELFVGLALAFQMILRYEEASESPSPAPLLGAMFLIPALALGISFALLQFPHMAESTQNRLNNGYVKFAKRYSRYDRHEIALSLYRRAYHNGKRTSKVYFGIANTLEELGRDEKAEAWLTDYAQTIKKKIQKKAKKGSPNPFLTWELARIYDWLSDDELYEKYRKETKAELKKLMQKEPRRASLYFLQGRLFASEHEYEKAARMFQKAHKLNPGRLLYRKKYFEYKEYLRN